MNAGRIAARVFLAASVLHQAGEVCNFPLEEPFPVATL